jgi:acyl carrier protein
MKKQVIKARRPAAATLTLTALAVIAPSHAADTPAQTRDGQKQPPPAAQQKARPGDKLRAEIREKVDRIVMSEFGVERKRVGPDSRFCKDYGGHSINLIEFFVRLEDAFGLEIPDEDAQSLHYLREVYAYVEKQVRRREQKT